MDSECVPQRELHYAAGFGFIQRSLGGGEFAKFLARVAAAEGIGAKTQVGDGQTIKPLRVGDVEYFPTEL